MERREFPGISAAVLKVFACITMIIDHMGATILKRAITDTGFDGSIFGIYAEWYKIYYVVRGIGRLSFPVFCFLAVEGFLHTRSLAGYAVNLFIFSLVSEIPFNLAFQDRFIELGRDFASTGDLAGTRQNVCPTILCAILVMYVLKRISQKEKWDRSYDAVTYLCAPLAGGFAVYLIYSSGLKEYLPLELNSSSFWYTAVLAAFFSLAALMITGSRFSRDQRIKAAVSFIVVFAGFVCLERLNTDYGGWGLLAMVVMYLFREDRFLAFAAGCMVLTLLDTFEGFTFFSIIPVMLYNGRRGRQNKYFFYSVYPGHLLILALICALMGL